jgi:transcriptional regulator with XRE-family HTH domain
VVGLRREELARVAGVSVPYYTRLEQGRAAGVSVEVLRSLASALRLSEDEARYLGDLVARLRVSKPRTRPAGRVRRSVDSLLSVMRDVPAVVLNQHCDLVAWNRLGLALLLPHVAPAETPPNMARAVFLDPRIRTLYPDWEGKARETAAYLRMSTGRYPDDQHLTRLVGELTIASPEFAAMWSAHSVAEKGHGLRRFQHPEVGELALHYETFRVTGDDHVLVLFHPADESRAGLHLLASWVYSDDTFVDRGEDDRRAARPSSTSSSR